MRIHFLTLLSLGLSTFAVMAFPKDLLSKSDDWFKSAEAEKAISCVLTWQSEVGSWPKNQDNTRKEFSGERAALHGTFDNGSTTDELRFLARAFRVTGDKRCESAFLLGLDHIFKAQYANGGWPQYFPLSKDYQRHITFNDDAMVRLMTFLREVTTLDDYAFVDAQRRSAAGSALQRGINCTLKCQVKIGNELTVWCAQHDEITLAPAKARAFELASLSGSESGGILCFLMSLENPSPEIISSVKAGVKWFDSVKLSGIRIDVVDGDRRVVSDANAVPIWARFYDLETRQPFFCGRDSVKKSSIAEIEAERRNGYAWYGNWGNSVANAYAKWPQR